MQQQVRILRRPPTEEEQRKRDLDEATLKDLRLSLVARYVQTLNSLNPGWKSDIVFCNKVQDVLHDAMFPGQTRPVSISMVAKELGIILGREELIRVGATVARLYREKHHSAPPKKNLHWADGADRLVNVYTDEDRELIEAALLKKACTVVAVPH